MIRYLEAGESHGKGLVAIIEGLPAGISVNIEEINRQLARRHRASMAAAATHHHTTAFRDRPGPLGDSFRLLSFFIGIYLR